MSSWIRVVTASQPITQAIDAIRALLANQPPGEHLWFALAEFTGIIVIASLLATLLFKRSAST